MRARVGKIIFLAVLITLCAAPGLSSELLQVETRGVGLLSLPPEWRVVSKDEPPERNLVSDWVLNVQQVLYAKTEHASGDPDAVLQIFSIWGADREGNEKPLPESILEAKEDLVGALIGERYGNVSKLGEDIIETAPANLSVATYGAEFFLADEDRVEFRYKYASLYRGEKRVLTLLKYKPEFEDYWHDQLGTILSAWVESLALTPALAVASDLEFSLPLPLPPPLVSPPSLPPIAQPEQPEPVQSVPAPEAPSPGRSISVVWLVSSAAFCIFCALAAHRRKGKQIPQNPISAETDPVPEERTEPDVHAPMRILPTIEEWLAEEHLVLKRPDSYDLPCAAKGEGFDKVYSLLNQALNTIETAEPTEEATTSVNQAHQEE